MRMTKRSIRSLELWTAVCAGLLSCGCGANYCWRSSVPEGLRTIAVSTFRNESDVSELGAVATRQILREIQREGTFKIKRLDDAALEIQGVIKSAGAATVAYDRHGARTSARTLSALAEVSVIDKRAHKVLVDNRLYEANASVTVNQDATTAMRDASGRLMDDLSRQIVDDLLNMKWGKDDRK